MPRLVPPPALPASPRRERRPPPPPPPGEGVALRLAIGREGIGLELAQPAKLGCLLVTELAATLPGVRFPVDVSGGVSRFRHRRGELQRLEIELGARALERFAASRLRGLLGTRSPEVWIGAGRSHATLCITAPPEPDDDTGAETPVLAFDVHALAEEGAVVLVVAGARGSALPAPATALAIGCIQTLLGGVAERQGAAFVVPHAATAVARALLPEAGARVPAARDVRWTAIAAQGDTWILSAVDGALGAAPDRAALRAREAAHVLRAADDALLAGDVEVARALCLEALDRAPRHPEIVRRIADVDARAGGRAEAALSLLLDLRDDANAQLGTLPGELLAEGSDTAAALASLERAGESDPAPGLAARALEMAARLVRDPLEALHWLDRALARAPRAPSTRWARVARRLAVGRVDDAMADAEHLEAMAKGGRAKHRVWLRAGRAWREAGLASRAGALFERALRYAPDEPQALAGLGVALVEEGRGTRGVAVLERAVEMADARGMPASGLLLDLGNALAVALEDLPAAIARVSAIPGDAPEALLARGLEGRWRSRLGDRAGASLAFARLRELAASLPPSTGVEREAEIVSLLREAASSARTHGEPLAAQRHLVAALRLRPRDAALLREVREIGALVARGPVADRDEDDAPPSSERGFESASPATLTDRPAPDLAPVEPDEDSNAAARAEELTRRLQGNPADDAVADELLGVLESLGRGHELLALASARLEDATPARRTEFAPRVRDALHRLAARAEAQGRGDDAALYRSAILILTGGPGG